MIIVTLIQRASKKAITILFNITFKGKVIKMILIQRKKKSYLIMLKLYQVIPYIFFLYKRGRGYDCFILPGQISILTSDIVI